MYKSRIERFAILIMYNTFRYILQVFSILSQLFIHDSLSETHPSTTLYYIRTLLMNTDKHETRKRFTKLPVQKLNWLKTNILAF